MTGTEKTLVERFRQGDIEAFDELFAITSERVYRFALRLTGNPQDAEDVTADTYVAAFQGLESFEGRSSVQTWLYRIVVHRAHRARRKRREASQAEIAEVCPRSESDLRAIELFELVAELPEKLKAPFLLVRAEGLSYEEAAKVLACMPGTVGWAVHRASQILRAAWGEERLSGQTDVPEVC